MDIRTPVPTIYGDMVARFSETWQRQIEQLRTKFGDALEEVRMPVQYPTDMPILYIQKDRIADVLRFLKEESGFEYSFLCDITATDEETDPRFEVVYHLYAMGTSKSRIRLKVRVREGEEVPTVCQVWEAANWAEREVFDMFGVKFRGHPDLRRILMDDRWEGHPLRKDYPLRGYQVFTTPMSVNTRLLED